MMNLDGLNPSMPEYWVAIRKPHAPSWPEHDPPFEVSNLDPRPADAPAVPRSVVSLMGLGTEAGWEMRVGYSRGPVRAKGTGTYKRVEIFGVWAGVHPDTGYRFSAMYQREIGKETWSWSSISIWRLGEVPFPYALVTDLKEFIRVSGSVGVPWFKAVEARELDKIDKQKIKAKENPTRKVRNV